MVESTLLVRDIRTSREVPPSSLQLVNEERSSSSALWWSQQELFDHAGRLFEKPRVLSRAIIKYSARSSRGFLSRRTCNRRVPDFTHKSQGFPVMKMMLFAVLALYPMMVFGRVPHSRKVLHEELNEIPLPEKYDDSSKDFQMQMKDWVKVSLNTPKVMAVQVGDRLEIECEALGGPKPTLAWNKGLHTRPIIYEETNNVNGMSLGRIISKLRFDCIQPEDEGMYSCSAASGSEFATSHHTMVFVHKSNGSLSSNCMEGKRRPQIDQWSPILMEVIGNDITLQCINSGNPIPEVFWLDKDEKLVENGSDSRFKILNSGDLLIRKLRWSDMGSYTCIAQNALGQTKETTFVYPMSE